MKSLRAIALGALFVALAYVPSMVLRESGAFLLPPIEFRQVGLFVASAFLGPAGWVGAALVFLATISHPLGANAWSVVSSLPILGALAAALLPRIVPGFDRSLRQPWCLGLVAAAALLWSVATAWVQARLAFPGATGSAWSLWTVTTLCTQLVGIIPTWMAAELIRERRAQDRLREAFRRHLPTLGALGVGSIAIALVAHELAVRLPVTRTWIALLLLAPVVVAAHRWTTAGGVIGAAAVGMVYLQATAQAGGGLGSHFRIVEHAGLVLTLWAVGALLGVAGWRQAGLVERLRAQQLLLERDLERVVRALSGAVEAKDEYTEGHLQRVTHYATSVGQELGLEQNELEMLRIAATLHDVGKIGIPESILRKPGPLNDDEYQVMQRHPEIGARLLAQLEGFEEAAALVLHHQERFDGRRKGAFPGYPAGLAGEEIPLGARIIAVVDAFDAMTSDRPYRRALPLEEAVSVLEREHGKQFDPRVVSSFLGLLEREPWFAPSKAFAQREPFAPSEAIAAGRRSA